jgi:hypothetical protein
MKMVRLTGVKGSPVWVSAGQVTHVAALETSENRLYGSNNAGAATTRIALAGGEHLDVREAAEEVAGMLDAG